MHEYIDSAKVIGSKNLDGRLTVASAPGLPFLLQEGMTVHFVPPVIDAPRQGRIESVQLQGESSAIVRVDSVPDIDTAEMLVGCHCLVSRDQLDVDALELVQQSEAMNLEGWQFVDEASGAVGIVASVDDMPGQIMLTLSLGGEDGQTALVPLVDDFIVDQDDEARKLILDLPGGILDL